MIAGHQLTTGISYVRIAGSNWPLIFDFRAIAALQQRVFPGDADLNRLQDVMVRVDADDIDALTVCLWAGMLREMPTLTFEETLTLLDEATPGELVDLPTQVLGALREAFGDANRGSGGDSSPWDWEMVLAIWIKEWGRSEEEFWRATFRTFRSISNGLSRLYEKARHDSNMQTPPEGYNIMDLLTMKGR